MSTRTALVAIVVVLCSLIGCQTAKQRQLQSENMFRNYTATWNTHDIEKMASFFADDCVYENLARGETYRGKEQLKAWAKGAFQAIPDFKLDLTSLFGSEDWLACEWVMTGKLTGDLPGLPATGKAFSVRGSSIVQLKDGKIVRNADYWDLMTFARQVTSQ